LFEPKERKKMTTEETELRAEALNRFSEDPEFEAGMVEFLYRIYKHKDAPRILDRQAIRTPFGTLNLVGWIRND